MLTQLLLGAVPVLFVYLFLELRHRRFYKYPPGLPQPKTSLLWGNMKVVHEYMQRLRPQEHYDVAFQSLWRDMGKPPLMLVDTWPGQKVPIVLVTSHEVAEQITKPSKTFPVSVPKSPTLGDYRELLGEHSILSMKDEEWKTLRRRVNPGFASQHLVTFIPQILEQTDIFLAHLDNFARTGEAFSLERLCTNLTFNIVGLVSLNVDFKAQTPDRNEVRDSFLELLDLYQERDSSNPLLPRFFIKRRIRRTGERLDAAVGKLVREQFEGAMQQQQKQQKDRSVLALSLRDAKELDPKLLAETADSLKTFLFAGHDTTSILLQWVFYELSRTPRALGAMRAELDRVFGERCSSPELMKQRLLAPGGGEELLQKLQYVSAVIKETLRLYPPVGTARHSPGGGGCVVRDETGGGREYCLDGLVLYVVHWIIQRDEAVYGPDAADFVPERWLGDADTGEETAGDYSTASAAAGKIPSTAWRPFERGPRSCIGQGLANLEARLIIALAARRYDFTKVGPGELELDDEGGPVLDDGEGQYKVKSELYTTGAVTRKAVGGTLMRVALSAQARRDSQ